MNSGTETEAYSISYIVKQRFDVNTSAIVAVNDTVNETFHVEYVNEALDKNVMIANVELESSINKIKSSTKYVFKGTQKEVEEKVEALRNVVAENKPINKI